MSLPLNLADVRNKRHVNEGGQETAWTIPPPPTYLPCHMAMDTPPSLYQPTPTHNPFCLELMCRNDSSTHSAAYPSPATSGYYPFYPNNFSLYLEQFELFNTLGTGTFGRVYLCRMLPSLTPPISPLNNGQVPYYHPGSYFALKMMSKREVLRLKQLEHVFSEKSILLACSHPFIIRLHGTFQNQRYIFMLLEYAPGGELFSYLKKFGRFSLPVTKFYAAELVLALEYLHSRNIVFRDLKPENLLLDEFGHIKIADFGFAKVLYEPMTWTLCGTPEYLAPEIIQGQGHSKEVDWWALGILIYEMLVGFPPFYDTNPFQIYEKILAGNIMIPEWIDNDTRSLITGLLAPDRTVRLGTSLSAGGSSDVKEHPWFKGTDWNALYWRRVPPPIRPVVSFPGDSANFERYPEIRPEHVPPWEVDPFQHLFADF